MILQAVVNFLSQLRHANLVKLIGYCIEDDQRLLVYEYMLREQNLNANMIKDVLNHFFKFSCSIFMG